MRPSKGFWGTGEKGIYFRRTWEQRPNFEGNWGTETILGNREHKKTNFQFLGNRGTSQFISGEQGNRYLLCEGLISLRNLKNGRRYTLLCQWKITEVGQHKLISSTLLRVTDARTYTQTDRQTCLNQYESCTDTNVS